MKCAGLDKHGHEFVPCESEDTERVSIVYRGPGVYAVLGKAHLCERHKVDHIIDGNDYPMPDAEGRE